MTYVHFVLVCEGTSDEALVEHLEKLLIWAGASEVSGVAFDPGRLPEAISRNVVAKLDAAVRLEPGANLIFVHRDADDGDPTPRLTEIQAAIAESAEQLQGRPCIAVVPVQETEAWLLLDESAIRRVAGRPSGRASLNLPRPGQVEATSSPKQILEEAILVASELTGRRRDRLRTRLPSLKSQLLRRLPVSGAIEQLPAWERLRDEVSIAVQRI